MSKTANASKKIVSKKTVTAPGSVPVKIAAQDASHRRVARSTQQFDGMGCLSGSRRSSHDAGAAWPAKFLREVVTATDCYIAGATDGPRRHQPV